jgi:hypothetical protein
LWQEKAARLPPIEEIRTVLDRSVRGTLSTFSKVTDCFCNCLFYLFMVAYGY